MKFIVSELLKFVSLNELLITSLLYLAMIMIN